MVKIKTNIGESAVTPSKQEQFLKILSTHLKIVRGIFAKFQGNVNLEKRYFYFDINAGDGTCQETQRCGSAMAFIKKATELEIPYNAFFIDENEDNCRKLKNEIIKFELEFKRPKNSSWQVLCGNNEIVLRDLLQDKLRLQAEKRWTQGMLYHDPNGAFNDKLISMFTMHPFMQSIEVLINCHTNILKRTAAIKKIVKSRDQRTLEQRINVIKKKYWFIRSPYGKQAWSFLLGTNWDHFPEFKNDEMFDKDTEKGKIIFDELNLTKPKFIAKYGKSFKEIDLGLRMNRFSDKGLREEKEIRDKYFGHCSFLNCTKIRGIKMDSGKPLCQRHNNEYKKENKCNPDDQLLF